MQLIFLKAVTKQAYNKAAFICCDIYYEIKNTDDIYIYIIWKHMLHIFYSMKKEIAVCSTVWLRDRYLFF